MDAQITRDNELYQRYQNHVSTSYPSFLKKFGIGSKAVCAQGACIIDSSGKEYIDCVNGYGIFNIGHNHPRIIRDLNQLLCKNQSHSKPFITDLSVVVSEKIAEISPGDLQYSFLCNSGSEATDNAIKLARLVSGKKEIITASNSFHGYTLGSLSACGIKSFSKYFEPLIPKMIQVPFGDIEALNKVISKETAAVLLEPVQHEAGVVVPPDDYLNQVRETCNQQDTLLILDEIKTGLGKTGFMFSCNKNNIVPDILVIGKSLGGGMIPVAAVIGSRSLWRKFSYCFPMAASSYAGNLLACQAAISTIDIIEDEKLVDASKEKGLVLGSELKRIMITYPEFIEGVSGQGLLFGLTVSDPQTALLFSKSMIENGVLAFPLYGDTKTIMIEPTFVISDEQIKKIINVIDVICNKMGNGV